MSAAHDEGFSSLEYYVLLAIADGPLYGYAIAAAVEKESDGVLTPRAGSLYRVIARLVGSGHVIEAPGPDGEESHPGRPRRWYELTDAGRAALLEEARRLKGAAALAEARLRSEYL